MSQQSVIHKTGLTQVELPCLRDSLESIARRMILLFITCQKRMLTIASEKQGFFYKTSAW